MFQRYEHQTQPESNISVHTCMHIYMCKHTQGQRGDQSDATTRAGSHPRLPSVHHDICFEMIHLSPQSDSRCHCDTHVRGRHNGGWCLLSDDDFQHVMCCVPQSYGQLDTKQKKTRAPPVPTSTITTMDVNTLFPTEEEVTDAVPDPPGGNRVVFRHHFGKPGGGKMNNTKSTCTVTRRGQPGNPSGHHTPCGLRRHCLCMK